MPWMPWVVQYAVSAVSGVVCRECREFEVGTSRVPQVCRSLHNLLMIFFYTFYNTFFGSSGRLSLLWTQSSILRNLKFSCRTIILSVESFWIIRPSYYNLPTEVISKLQSLRWRNLLCWKKKKGKKKFKMINSVSVGGSN